MQRTETTRGPAADWRALAAGLAGRLLVPGGPGYEEAWPPAMPRAEELRPAAIVRCAADGDVVEALAAARRHGLELAVRSGGHCFAGHSSTRGLLLDVSELAAVELADGLVRIGAGARLGAVYDALAPHGLTLPAGCGPTVGIAGLALGGGLGVLGRRHGVLSDALAGARVVLPDGSVVDCDEERHADLFWALRGAGAGHFGVVTELVFRPCQAPDAACFHLVWGPDAAPDVVAAWQAWSPDAPDELAASLVLAAPADPGLAVTAAVFGAFAGPESDATELLEGLVARVGRDPDAERRESGPYREVKRRLSELAPTGEPARAGDVHATSRSGFFARELPAEGITTLVGGLLRERVPGQARELDLTPWGGAYGRVLPDATAFVHRGDRFLLKHGVAVAASAGAAERDAARAWLTASWSGVQRWGTGRSYQNFPDPQLDDPAAAYYGSNLPRLVRVRRRYDPGRVLRRGVVL